MSKCFNTTGLCLPEKHYMVDLTKRVDSIVSKYIDTKSYFVINRARQFGKTTLLEALYNRLKEDYVIISISFEGKEDYFVSLQTLAEGLFFSFRNALGNYPDLAEIFGGSANSLLPLQDLSERITTLCRIAEKEVILMVDEVDRASNYSTFLSFLGMLRDKFLERQKGRQPAFSSVILAGVHDIKNLKLKLRPEEQRQYNSPWNIAADFDIDMSFSVRDIEGMLCEYEADHRTKMDIGSIAQLIHDYTSGYPYLTSRICKLIDETPFEWNERGVEEAVKVILNESNTLFDDMFKRIAENNSLSDMLCDILFSGKSYAFTRYDYETDIGTMFGLVANHEGQLVISNRIYETMLYNYFLHRYRKSGKYASPDYDRNQFINNGQLDMDLVMRKFVDYFTEIYGDSEQSFIEENGRRLFLLYLKPIINGTGNYYIEARTRDLHRTDVIVDYKGKRYIIELKIWHGDEYNRRGEEQLAGYLDFYGENKGWLLSFNFNKNKAVGIKSINCGDKVIVEAVV